MTDVFFTAIGENASTDALAIPHAQDLTKHLVRLINPYARFIEARITVEGAARVESIVFDVDVELSQIRQFDIHATERISVSFTTDDDTWPEVLALREDFPLVPHLNLRPVSFRVASACTSRHIQKAGFGGRQSVSSNVFEIG